MNRSATRIVAQIAFALVLLGIWQLYGTLAGDQWTSLPTLVAARIWDLARNGGLIGHIATTLSEIVMGLVIGVPLGTLVGILLGRTQVLSSLLRPVIVAANSVPIVALAPLLIMWFGLGLSPKVALVALVSFFLLFFNTYSGVTTIDRDLLDGLRLMGANRRELLWKVVLPATMPWVLSGLRSALPYSLIAATVGEMMLARSGLGFLVTEFAGQYDMSGVFAALVVLMILGVIIAELAARCERWILRWRGVAGA
jgi:NitT/TauT family transport system permease protein